MSTIVIEIETDSPAFRDEGGNYNPGPEASRILHSLAERLWLDVPEPHALRDLNDNVVGRFEVTKGKIPTRDQLNDWLDVAENALDTIRTARYPSEAYRIAGRAHCIVRNRRDLYDYGKG